MTRLALLILCVLSLLSCKAQAATADTGQVVARTSDEVAEREEIFKKVRTAIAADDFASLSAMEDDFRSSRARTPSGVWKLAVYHAGLQAYLADGLQQDKGCQYLKSEFVGRWASAAPDNPAPVITGAALLLAQAWCIRGAGYANTVAAEAWPRFHKGAAAAYELLESHRTFASADPEFYAIKVKVLGAQGASKALLHSMIEEAAAREPYYSRTYINAANFYLPQWGGSYAEIDALARYAAEQTRTTHKSAFYARVFWSLDECGCGILEKAVDWPTMKQAMRDLYERYPTTHNGQDFADLSCRMSDGEEGRHYIRAVHPEVTGDIQLVALFAACDRSGQARN